MPFGTSSPMFWHELKEPMHCGSFLASMLFRGVDFETRGSYGTGALFETNTFWDEAQGR